VSIKLSWKQPKRESGRPLDAADIDRYELTATLDGEAQPVAQPAPGDLTLTVPATEPGVYAFALVCVPKRGEKSDPATGSVELFDETKVVTLDLTVEVIA